MNESASECPGASLVREGLERHLDPAGNGHGVVTKLSSDTIFGPEGLGFAGTPWTRLVSWLARNGISEQTGSKPDETSIPSCVLGWGQGAFSSRVFDKDRGVDRARLAQLIAHLQGIAEALGDRDQRITGRVLGVYVGSQQAAEFLTAKGPRKLDGFRDRVGSRFRSHIQWQALYTLCGQVSGDGIKEVTPELLNAFFTCETPFFAQLVERRRLLRSGALKPGARSGPLSDVAATIDPERTDEEYLRVKSGLWMIARIAVYMLTQKSLKNRNFD
jgi:hypothetical protein